MNNEYPLEFLSAFSSTLGSAEFKSKPEDFIVDEVLDIELSGQGEHLWFKVVKKGENTAWVAEQLALHYEVASFFHDLSVYAVLLGPCTCQQIFLLI